jgi:DNA invertase Pin-like site-specific DNA recombinase
MNSKRKPRKEDRDGAVLYIRVSTNEQARHGVSLEAQEARLRAYCEMRGLTVIDVIRDEGVSAFKHLDTRPGGARLLGHIASGSASHVVALKLDRIFRNAADALAMTESWDRAGVAIHLVDMGGAAMDTSSATGRMMLTMLAGFARFERDLISERTSAALVHKRAKREAYAPTPLGYRRDGKALLPDESELATVARIQAMWASGRRLAAIARQLNAEGVATKRGGRWHASTVRYILQNELYASENAVA